MTALTTYANHLAIHRTLDLAPALQGLGLGAHDLLVLTVIARHLGHDGQPCWLAYETIAAEALCSRRTVIRAVQALASSDFVEIVGRKNGRTNLYRVLYNECQPATSATQSPHECQSDTGATESPVSESHLTSATQSPHECQRDTSPVSESHLTSATQSPEVGQQIDQEVGQRNRSRTSSQEDARTEGSAPLSEPVRSSGQAKLRRVTLGGPAKPKPALMPTAMTAQPTPEPTGSADGRELALTYWTLLRRPPNQVRQRDQSWPSAFDRLLLDRDKADIAGAVRWAFEVSDFWPQHLFRRTGDPVEYLAARIDSILPQFYAWQRSQENVAKRTTPKTAPVPVSTISKMFKIE